MSELKDNLTTDNSKVTVKGIGAGTNPDGLFNISGDLKLEHTTSPTGLVFEGVLIHAQSDNNLYTNGTTGGQKQLHATANGLDQELDTTSSPIFAGLSITNVAPKFSLVNSALATRTLQFNLDVVNKTGWIKADDNGVEPYTLRLQPDIAQVGIGYSVAQAWPEVTVSDPASFATYCPETNYHFMESGDTDKAISTIYRNARYPTISGTRNTAPWEFGLFLQTAGQEANDKVFIGRSGLSTNDLVVYRSGNVAIGTTTDSGFRFTVDDSLKVNTTTTMEEIAEPSAPATGATFYSNSSEAGQPFVKLKNGANIGLVSSNIVTTAINYEALQQDDLVLVDTSGGDVTISWDQPNLKGVSVTIKKTDAANNVILDPTTGNIEGSATFSFSTLNQSVTFVSDGTNSFISSGYLE